MSALQPSSRFLSALRRRGLVGTIGEGVRRGANSVYVRRRLLFFRAPLSAISRVAPRLNPTDRYECQPYSIAEIRALPNAPPDIARLLEQYLVDAPPALEVMLSRVNEEIAGWFFVHVGACKWPLTETETTVDVPATDAVWTSAYTRPEFRGRGIHPALIGACADRSLARGATHALVWCEEWNEPSKKNMERAGLVLIGSHERTWFFSRPSNPRIEMAVDHVASV